MNPLDTSPDRAPSWMSKWLIAAGLYNIAWGAFVVLFPNALFRWTGVEPLPAYPQLWQCIGMIVGVYGIGYLAAARDPRRHWPIVLVGLLGKIFGPIGFAQALYEGVFPITFGVTIITNDLIWWVPFSMMLWDSARAHGRLPEAGVSLDEALDTVTSADGRTLRDVTNEKKTLVVLLRHTGCTFCKETLAELREHRGAIEDAGLELAIVTMSGHDENRALLERYGLEDAHAFSDPDRLAYRALELRRGSFMQLFGPASWGRGALATLKGHRPGRLVGDGFQMPGSFVIHEGSVLKAHRHESASERLDHASFCERPA